MKKDEKSRESADVTDGVAAEDLWEETAVMSEDKLLEIKEKMVAQMNSEEDVSASDPWDQNSEKIDSDDVLHDRITLKPETVGAQPEPLNTYEKTPDDAATDKPLMRLFQEKYKLIIGVGIGIVVLVVVVLIVTLSSPSEPEKKVYVASAKAENKNEPVKESEKDKGAKEEPVQASEDLGTIHENYQTARKFYLEGDRGRSADGKKLNKKQRIESLLSAVPYFDKLLKQHEKENTKDPNVWFLKARTEYTLAKFDHERERNAKLAIESYRTFKKLFTDPSRNQKKTMSRNMKALRSWTD